MQLTRETEQALVLLISMLTGDICKLGSYPYKLVVTDQEKRPVENYSGFKIIRELTPYDCLWPV